MDVKRGQVVQFSLLCINGASPNLPSPKRILPKEDHRDVDPEEPLVLPLCHSVLVFDWEVVLSLLVPMICPVTSLIWELSTCVLGCMLKLRRFLILPHLEVWDVVRCRPQRCPSRARLFLCTFWRCGASSACIKWHKSIRDAKLTDRPSCFACRTTSVFGFTILKAQVWQCLKFVQLFLCGCFAFWHLHRLVDGDGSVNLVVVEFTRISCVRDITHVVSMPLSFLSRAVADQHSFRFL